MLGEVGARIRPQVAGVHDAIGEPQPPRRAQLPIVAVRIRRSSGTEPSRANPATSTLVRAVGAEADSHRDVRSVVERLDADPDGELLDAVDEVDAAAARRPAPAAIVAMSSADHSRLPR